jgi:hypothetical protein
VDTVVNAIPSAARTITAQFVPAVAAATSAQAAFASAARMVGHLRNGEGRQAAGEALGALGGVLGAAAAVHLPVATLAPMAVRGASAAARLPETVRENDVAVVGAHRAAQAYLPATVSKGLNGAIKSTINKGD